MRIGWIADDVGKDEPQVLGGAELTEAEFRAAAPEGVEIVNCPHNEVDATCDRYVVQNCVFYQVSDLLPLEGKPVTKYWHDVGPWMQPGVRGWLETNATNICCSPLQAAYMGFDDVAHIPPPVDLRRFMAAAASMNGQRRGNVCVGSWRNHGKAPHKVAEWAMDHGPVQFYGDGPWAPPGAKSVAYERMPELLASYKRFVFLPNVLEPFGRAVAEAWAAGCELIVNGNVGAAYWIQEDPAAIERASEDFWNVVLS
jgi:hypothetical protein